MSSEETDLKRKEKSCYTLFLLHISYTFSMKKLWNGEIAFLVHMTQYTVSVQ